MKKNILKLTFLALFSLAFAACTEEIDESARYTFTGETVTDYLNNNLQYSEYAKMITEVPISTHSGSNVAQLLSARGNYVVFAPTNAAIGRYLETVKAKDIIPATVQTIDEIADQEIADSLKRVIVYNSIVDYSEYQTVFQYISDIAPTNANSKTMVYSNMNNRFLTVNQVESIEIVDDNGESRTIDSYPIEGAHTSKYDIQVYNGIVHEMYEVVAPSNDNMLDVLFKTPEVSAFVDLMNLISFTSEDGTTRSLKDSLLVQEDDAYHELYWSDYTLLLPAEHITQHTKPEDFKKLEQRYIGFTAFVETDEAYERAGLLGADGKVDLNLLKAYLADKQPAGLSQGEDYENENNWLNFYVTYHLLPMTIDYDYLVIHYNELGYRWSVATSKPTIVQTEHYTTMGKPRLLNISEGSDTVVNGTYGKRLNYFAKTYRSNVNPFSVQEIYKQGILVKDPSTFEKPIEQPVNGMIYPIDELLVYTEETAQLQGTERMRMDVCSFFPELMTNRLRRRYNNIGDIGFSKYYKYLANMNWSDESNVYYLPGYNSAWANYQGDEFNITGIYDITIKMPPIPYSNTYELRIGVSVNPTRGMMQVYFGTDPDALPAAGIPLDMRVGGIKRYEDWNGSNKSDSNIGWELDNKTQDEYGVEVELTTQSEIDDNISKIDKTMRLQGFMKAPAGFAKSPEVNVIDVNGSLRNNCETYGDKGNALRRILVRQDMQAGEQYYIRFKSVLDNVNSQFFLDYFELVPKEVYDNPINPEDIW